MPRAGWKRSGAADTQTLARLPLSARAAAAAAARSFIYTDSRPFEKLPRSYKCPSCKAPKANFVQKDVSAAKALPLQLAAVAALAAAAAYAVQQL